MTFEDIVNFSNIEGLKIRDNSPNRDELKRGIYCFEVGYMHYDNKVVYLVCNPQNKLIKDKYYLRFKVAFFPTTYENVSKKRIKQLTELIKILRNRDLEFNNLINSRNAINKFLL